MRVGVVAKADAPEAPATLAALLGWVTARGFAVTLEKETAGLAPAAPGTTASRAELPGQADVIVVLGGDGTLLSVARAVGDLGVPILGVNLGGLGFLTATTRDEMLPALDAFVAGQTAIDDRMMLMAALRRGGVRVWEHLALNDVVITKSALSRIIRLSVSVEGRHAIAYRADGLIISTPTGSTAYCLSAGGPILYPSISAIVLTPICSHALTNRPIVLPGALRVEARLLSDQEVMLSVDGQVGIQLVEGDTVEVQEARPRIRLVRLPETDIFSVLRTKLKWGER
jgi:NAD+ kinase